MADGWSDAHSCEIPAAHGSERSGRAGGRRDAGRRVATSGGGGLRHHLSLRRLISASDSCDHFTERTWMARARWWRRRRRRARGSSTRAAWRCTTEARGIATRQLTRTRHSRRSTPGRFTRDRSARPRRRDARARERTSVGHRGAPHRDLRPPRPPVRAAGRARDAHGCLPVVRRRAHHDVPRPRQCRRRRRGARARTMRRAAAPSTSRTTFP